MTEPDLALAMRRIADEAAIIRIANSLDRAVDAKQWEMARSFFAERIRTDFGSKKTSLHLRGGHVVDVHGDAAVVTSSAYAWNRMEGKGDPLWEVWGQYRYELERVGAKWRITLVSFHPTHERGNDWVKTTPG
jgi:hypothetical protein